MGKKFAERSTKLVSGRKAGWVCLRM